MMTSLVRLFNGETWKRHSQRIGKDGETTYYFEDVPSDDCFGHIDIKSDP